MKKILIATLLSFLMIPSAGFSHIEVSLDNGSEVLPAAVASGKLLVATIYDDSVDNSALFKMMEKAETKFPNVLFYRFSTNKNPHIAALNMAWPCTMVGIGGAGLGQACGVPPSQEVLENFISGFVDETN